MRLTVSPEIFERFPNVTIGILAIRGLNHAPSDDLCNKLLSEQESRIRMQFSKETFTEHPRIAIWRKVYADFGVKPKEAKSSIENLYRIVLSGRDIRRISTLVDLYNYISLKYMLPMGGEDLDTTSGNIELTIATENENEVLLLGDEKPSKPKVGEVIYKDSISAICRCWNWREADRTKLTESTSNCILVIEGVDIISPTEIQTALTELEELVKTQCGGEARQYLLRSDNQSTPDL